MDRVQLGDYEYIILEREKIKIVFTTSKGRFNFNIASREGLNNVEILRKQFDLEDVGYLNQIHSDSIFPYDGQIHQGDGLITDRKNTGLGVFTADCVPIMIYDGVKGVISAVHSGWKGTYMEITAKAIRKMCEEYGSRPSDLYVHIGPHNRQCCYEIGDDVKEKFAEKRLYSGCPIVIDNKLSMEQCIIRQCLSEGILRDSIETVNICTFCSKEYDLYSYRRNNTENGRLFSLIFMKD
jgi:polyphenol oxidase